MQGLGPLYTWTTIHKYYAVALPLPYAWKVIPYTTYNPTYLRTVVRKFWMLWIGGMYKHVQSFHCIESQTNVTYIYKTYKRSLEIIQWCYPTSIVTNICLCLLRQLELSLLCTFERPFVYITDVGSAQHVEAGFPWYLEVAAPTYGCRPPFHICDQLFIHILNALWCLNEGCGIGYRVWWLEHCVGSVYKVWVLGAGCGLYFLDIYYR